MELSFSFTRDGGNDIMDCTSLTSFDEIFEN